MMGRGSRGCLLALACGLLVACVLLVRYCGGVQEVFGTVAADRYDPVAINNVPRPNFWEAGSRKFAGPFPLNGALYSLATVGADGTPDQTKPQFWKSTDGGRNWRPLPVIAPGIPWTHFGVVGGAYCFCWDLHGPFPTTVFFYAVTNSDNTGVVAAQLFNYNLSAETWGTPYGTVGFPQRGLGTGLIALSDGRVKLFYTSPVDGTLMWAVANTGGSGAWDSIDNVILAASGPASRRMWSVAVDPTDRCHLLYDQGLAPRFKTYLNQDSAEVSSAPQTIVQDRHGTSPNQISVLNGSLYVPSAGNELALDSVELFTGAPLDAPVFTRELVHNYPEGAFSFNLPYYAAIDLIGGALTIIASVESHDDTPVGPDYFTVDYYQKNPLTGTWAQGTYIDFRVNHPRPPFLPDPTFIWGPEDLSFGPVSDAVFGIGIVVALDVIIDSHGNTAGMEFYLFAPALITPVTGGGGGRSCRLPGPRYCYDRPYDYPLEVRRMPIVERHQDYQLTVPLVPPGGVIQVPLQLDSDAPFALRLVRSRKIGLNGWRFQTPTGRWQSNGLRTDWIVPADPAASPFPSRGSVIYPQIVYPADSQIVVDIGNATNQTIVNARLLFRGSKLYREGSIPSPTYPARILPLPFAYQVLVAGLGVGAPGTRLNNQLRVQNDGDLALRYAVCDPFSLGVDGGAFNGTQLASNLDPRSLQVSYTELYARIKDESGKAYSNEPIHVNDLFGQGRPVPDGGGATDMPVSFFAGLFTPEIYIPRDHSLYFDLFRLDASGPALDLYFRFSGAKVMTA